MQEKIQPALENHDTNMRIKKAAAWVDKSLPFVSFPK
jgi:hypothetical protein